MFRRRVISVLTPPRTPMGAGLKRWFSAWARWIIIRVVMAMLALILLFSVLNPPTTLTMLSEGRLHRMADRQWVRLAQISPAMQRAVVAAEDANFCRHWGFDMREIRKVIAAGQHGGASTLTQQTVKNVFLWQNRSWPRKALEAVMTPPLEALWSKRRILEVYLNVAEFGPGIFGIHAAARVHFDTTPDRLTPVQSARLAAILPAPKLRRPDRSSPRSRAIADGAATIAKDGRDNCLQLGR